MKRMMKETPINHVKAALDLFRSGKKWNTIYNPVVYRESEYARRWKVLSLEVPAGSFFEPTVKRSIPYLRYYYEDNNDVTMSGIKQIHEMISEQYQRRNLQISTEELEPMNWGLHCVYQKDRMVRLTTLHKKFGVYRMNDLKHLISVNEKLKLVRKNGHYYVAGLRFRGARCLDSPK